MGSRSNVDRGITIARLDGTSGFCVANKIPHDDAVAQIRAISTDLDLLEEAAAGALTRWRKMNLAAHNGRAIAELLVDAGADRERVGTLSDERLAARPTPTGQELERS